ncbi:hypothetical protein ATY81_22415 [Rhizobium sp. R72]|uniref:hypothetical protein n=1 Tax=unclassified Rhizobium TaxID=2613769 RepID=UPI000B533856|nr:MULTISPECIES: hypothetical protein [unclassified Rhizobium]OWW02392.1 hypothetical protein ATY81_22415 [Rhizobium sp. R72]OWW02526.1 hypothetical protein ATY80_22415 [Rhizobium sp. R711]
MTTMHPTHFRHGWAALKMKCPHFRQFEGKEHFVQDLCEAYSEAILFRDRMRLVGDLDLVVEYDQTCRELEKAVYDDLVIYSSHPQASLPKF